MDKPDETTPEEIDARGLLCPLPVLKLRKRLQKVAHGGMIDLLADDPAAAIDVPHFCSEAGHDLISQESTETHVVYRVRRATKT